MIFTDRVDAGRHLAAALKDYENREDSLVIALPRGGVVVGYEIATRLHLPLDIVCPRKIGAPFNPEVAIGAMTESGECFLWQDLGDTLNVSESFIKSALEKEKERAKWQLDHYRQGRQARDLKNKKVILVDDGIATGATMHAAIKTVRAALAKEIIMSIPVAPSDTLAALTKDVDKVICLAVGTNFYSVGQYYENFEQTTDDQVITLLRKTTPK